MCSVRKEREPGLSRGEARLSVYTVSCCSCAHARARADNTPQNSLSPSLSPFCSFSSSSLSPSLSCYPSLFPARGRRLDVPFRSSRFSRLFAPRSRSVFLRCSKRAGPAITRSRLTVAPCMAACFMLPASHCDAHRASERARSRL